MHLDLTKQRQQADTFRKLHDGSRILILPNVWDAASARMVEEAGFPALATTSSGVAWTLGYPDGEYISREEMVERIGRIVHAVGVPVTADMEAGYGPAANDVAATVKATIAAGAVGLNLEDGLSRGQSPLFELSAQVERIQAGREAAAAAGVPIVINARTDVYLRKVGADEKERFRLAVHRLNAYRVAGADCLFIPDVYDAPTIGALVREIAGPLNVLAGPGTPSIPELQKLGVARLSFGGKPMRAALTLLRRICAELLGPGTFAGLTQDLMTHGEVDALFRSE